MIISAISLLHVLLGEVGFYKDNPKSMLILLGTIFLLGAIHFLYAKCLLNASMTEEFEDFSYNFRAGQVDKVSEALMIPNLSYEIEF